MNKISYKKIASDYKQWQSAYMKKKQDRPFYSTVVSVRVTKAERETWIQYADKLGLSSNRFLGKGIADYIEMISQPPGKGIKVPAFLAYCRSIVHGGDEYLKT